MRRNPGELRGTWRNRVHLRVNERQYLWLKEQARQRRISIAAVVRSAIDLLPETDGQEDEPRTEAAETLN